MPEADHQIGELKRAYRVLDVPLTASAATIEEAYRRLTKRWHPDLYPAGTPALADATHMMKLINAAYSDIKHAPLRYHIESYPRASEKRRRTPSTGEVELGKARRDTLPVTDRVEFWVRFGCGALLGAFMSINLVLIAYDEPKLLIAGAGTLIVVCALATARFGDRFWSLVLEYGWLWW